MDPILSIDADKDVEAIALYTLDQWGEKQTRSYLNDLQHTFKKKHSTCHR